MSSYTILGSGRTAKLLRLTDLGTAEAVTTAPADVLQAVSIKLTWLKECTLGSLYQYARSLAGQPVQLRRTLLALFDATLTGNNLPAAVPPVAGLTKVAGWVSDVALLCRELPGPVQVALRAEVATHLDGLDGVLVPASISDGSGYRPERVDLVISPALAGLPDDEWLELFAWCEGTFDEYALGGPSDELAYSLTDQYDETSSMSEVMAACRARHDGGGCQIKARPDWVHAWLRANRPHLMEHWPAPNGENPTV